MPYLLSFGPSRSVNSGELGPKEQPAIAGALCRGHLWGDRHIRCMPALQAGGCVTSDPGRNHSPVGTSHQDTRGSIGARKNLNKGFEANAKAQSFGLT